MYCANFECIFFEATTQPPTLLMAALTSSSSAMNEHELAERCNMRGDVSCVQDVLRLWAEWKFRVRAMGKRGPWPVHDRIFDTYMVPLLETVMSALRFMTVEVANGGMWFVATAHEPLSMQVKACCEGFEVRGLAGTCHVEVHYYEPRSYHAHVLMNNDIQAKEGGWRANVCAYAAQAHDEVTELPRALQMDYDCAIPATKQAYILTKWSEQPESFTGKFADTRQMPGGWMDPARSEQARVQAALFRAEARVAHLLRDTSPSTGTRQFGESVNAAIANATPAPSVVATPSAQEAVVVVCLPFMCKQMFALTSNHTCVVCQEETTESTHRALSCGHFLCCECLDRVLAQTPKKRTCPLCRAKISKN
jgi:hypothetical protein